MAKDLPKQEARRPQVPQAVASLEQIRILADPLRLRILGALALQPRTTKQVAGLLGEKHTKLYHHVQALERVHLIRLVETRPKRGTIERYYQTTARRFQAPASVLSPRPGDKPSDLAPILNALLDTARGDLLARVRATGAPQPRDKASLFAARLLIRGSAQRTRAVRQRLSRLVQELKALKRKGRNPRDAGEGKSRQAYALTIIFCPTDEI